MELSELDFAILYTDGSVYVGPAHLAPAAMVSIIVQRAGELWIMTQQFNFYTWEDGRWIGSDLFGLIQHLFHSPPGWKKVLLGRQVLLDTWTEHQAIAKGWRDYARENGHLPPEVMRD